MERITVDTAIAFATALGLFLLLQQGSLHHSDPPRLIQECEAGDARSERHFLYLPLGIALRTAARPLGMSSFQALLLLSQLGGAVAVAFVYRSLRVLGETRRAAWIGTTLFAVCPGICYFATTVEIHAPFMAFAAMAWWSMAGAVGAPRRSGRLLRVAGTGVISGVGAGVHGTGHLLLGLLVMLWWVRGRRREWWVVPPLLLGVHAVTIAALARICAGGGAVVGGQASFLLQQVADTRLADAAVTAGREWLLALAPLTGIGLLGMVVGTLRHELRWFHLALLPYLVTVAVLLDGIPEYGAYVLPSALPLAWAAARTVRPRLAVLLVVVSFALLRTATAWNAMTLDAVFAADVAACAAGSPMHLKTCGRLELDSLARFAPWVEATAIEAADAARSWDAARLPEICAALDGTVRGLAQRGAHMVFTDGALEHLGNNPQDPLGRLVHEHLARHYRLEPVVHGTFRGQRVLPKPD